MVSSGNKIHFFFQKFKWIGKKERIMFFSVFRYLPQPNKNISKRCYLT